MEPLLGPVKLLDHILFYSVNTWMQTASKIHLVIVGGEGNGRRPFDLAWARSIRDECKASGVAFFMKQLGSNAITTTPGEHGPNICERLDDVGARINNQGWRVRLDDKNGGNMPEWPEDIRIREMPKGS